MNNTRNEIGEVAARATRRFLDHTVDCVFHACLPVYELRLKVMEIAEDELSRPARFVLQLSNLNVTRPGEISRLLGISDSYVAGAAAELLGDNLVTQWPDLGLGITVRGKQVLSDGGKTQRPRNTHFKVPYDPLTRKIIDIDIELLLDRTDARKNGLFIAPTKPKRPRLSNIRLDEVREYHRFFGRRLAEAELIEISAIKEIRLKYRSDVILVKLSAPNTDMPVFAAYRSQQYLEEESASIQRLADRGADLVPEELQAEPSLPQRQPSTLTQEESNLFEEIGTLDHNVGETEQAVSEAKATQGTTQDAQERANLEDRIQELEAEKHELKSKLNERERKLNTLTKGKVYQLKTEEHRPLLFHAIARATSELTLVSAWINPRAFDGELCRMLAAAIKRGTEVRIAWGLGTHKPGSEADRHREFGNSALAVLRRLIPESQKGKLKIKRTETHEKFIICDNQFCAWGSFNWLSYRGEVDSGYRRETSMCSERQADIVFWNNIATELFQG